MKEKKGSQESTKGRGDGAAAKAGPVADLADLALSLQGPEQLEVFSTQIDDAGVEALLHGAAPAARINGLRLLGLKAQALPGLVEALSDVDSAVRLAAAQTLAIVGVQAPGLLLEAARRFPQQDAEAQGTLAEACAQLLEHRGEDLLELLRDEAATVMPLHGLFTAMGPGVVPLLNQGVVDLSPLIRANALRLLCVFAEQGLEVDLRHLEAALADGVAEVREAAAGLLRVVDAKLEMDKHAPKPLPIAGFAEFMLEVNEIEQYQANLNGHHLAALLSDGRMNVRANAARGLGVIGWPTHQLVLALKDGEAAVREAAAWALARLAQAGHPALLLRAVPVLHEQSDAVTAPILRGLAELAGKEDGLLIEALRVPSTIARQTVLQVFELLGAVGLPILYEALRHESLMIRLNAIEGIGRLWEQGHPIDVGGLDPALEDTANNVRQRAVEIREAAWARSSRKPQLLEARPLPSEAFGQEVLEVEALEAMKAALDLAVIQPLLSDGRAVVRANAARSLGVLGEVSPHLSLLLRDSDDGVRSAAAHAVQLLGPAAQSMAAGIVSALQGASVTVAQHLREALRSWVGVADAALIEAMRIPVAQAEQSLMPLFDAMGEEALPLLSAALKNDSNQVRMNALQGLHRLVRSGVEVEIALIRPLTFSHLDEIKRAAEVLYRAILTRRRRPNEAIKVLPTADFDSRRLTAEELDAAGLSVELLEELLDDGRPMVRANATAGLSHLGHASARLGILLLDGDGEVRRAAAQALVALGAEAASLLPRVVSVFEKADDEISELLTQAFRNLIGVADDVLIETLRMPSARAESTALALFARLGEAALPIALRALRDESVMVRVNAGLALERLMAQGLWVDMAPLQIAAQDHVEEFRRIVQRLMRAVQARQQSAPYELPPMGIADFNQCLLSREVLEAARDAVDVDRVVMSFHDGRLIGRANAAALAAYKGPLAPAHVEALAIMLRDVAVEVRREAGRSLGLLKQYPQVVVPRLLAAMHDADPDTRAIYLEAIEAYGDAAAPHVLAALERPGVDVNVALDPLVERRRDLFLPPLVEIARARHSSEIARLRAVRLLTQWGQDDEAAQLVVKRYYEARKPPTADVEPPPRRERGKPVEAEPWPIPDFDTAYLDAGVLKKHTKTLGVERLRAALSDGRVWVRRNAVVLCGLMGKHAGELVYLLALSLKDSEEDVVLAAVETLARLRQAPEHCVPALAERMPLREDAVQQAILQALAAHGDDVPPILVRQLIKYPAKYLEILMVLVRPQPEPWIDLLVGALGAEHPLKVREAALLLLLQMGGAVARIRPVLLALLDEKDGALCMMAVQTLAKLPFEQATVDRLLQLRKVNFLNSVQNALRGAFIALLGEIPEEEEEEPEY